MTDYGVAMRNALLYREAERLLERSRAAAIPLLFLKGIYLAQEVYEDISRRPMTDIDVMTRADDVLRLAGLLREAGYEAVGDVARVLADPLSYAVTFQRPDPERRMTFYVDVHWHFLTSTWLRRLLSDRFDGNGFIERAIPFPLGEGLQAFTLSVGDHAVFLAQHCFSHGFDKPMMLEDIRRMWGRIKNGEARRDVRREAGRWGLREVLDFTLGYAFLGTGEERAPRLIFWIARFFRLYRIPCLLFLLIQERIGGVLGYIGRLVRFDRGKKDATP